MQDKDGNLLFFIVDGRVYNKEGEIMAYVPLHPANNYPQYPLLAGANELLIIPDPFNCNKYYIFGDKSVVHPLSNLSEPQYTILDLLDPDLMTPLDLVVNDLPSLPNYTFIRNVHNKYAATKLRPDNSRLVFINTLSKLIIFKIDASGLNLVHIIDLNTSNFGFSTESEVLDNRSELEIIETTNTQNQLIYRVGYSFRTTLDSWVVVNADIDYNSLNFIPGTEEYVSLNDDLLNKQSNIHGLEFSPDASKLFFTHETNLLNNNVIEYHEIGYGNNVKQPMLINNAQEFQFTQIEVGKDGAMYFVGEQNNTGNRLAKLTSPNTASGWLDYAITVNYNYSIAGDVITGASYKKLYLLPDQIDGMNYAAHFTANTECCLANTTFSTTTYSHEQGGVQNWTTSLNPFGNTSTITVKDELVIKNGANIVANGLTFEFAPDAKLVVERGAIFTINGCTLTVETTCENTPMWNGVDVQGPSANQQSVDAGRFIANNSLIEHAYWATHNYSTAKGAPGVFWETGNRGGVILATNTTFRNNHRGTVFFDFQNINTNNQPVDDESKFSNCTFVTDAPLNKPNLTPTVIMAHLFGVQGVNFSGCDFKFTSTDPSIAAHERGSGIEAYNCLLTVNSLLTGGLFTDRSTFVNLTRGVDANSSIGSPRTTRVTNSDFDNVWRCIYLKSNELATITNNTFDVASDNAWSHGYGLYLDYCNRFKVENNAFTTTHNGFIGTYTWDSQQGTNNNEIYRNTFSNFVIGSQAAGNNGNRSTVNGGLGLEYRCNNYTNINNADIYVSSGWLKPTNGNCSTVLSPANNQFSRTTTVGDFWQDNLVVDHVTYQYSQPNGYNVNPIQYNGVGQSNNTFPTVCNNSLFNPVTSCPARIKKSQFTLLQDLSAEKLVVGNLNENVAVGDAKALYQAIQTQSAGNVKNALMAASPYLSDNVLIAYLQSNAPIGNLKQVLLANSPLSDDVMAVLNQLNIPKGIKTQIANAQTGTSAMQELKTEIAYHKNEVSKIQNEVLRYILFEDDVEERYREAIEFIKQESACSEKRCELIAFYTANKEYTKAEQELSEMIQQQENADFVKLYSNIIQLEQATDAIEELKTNTSILQPVIEVADMPIRKQETAMAEVMLKQAKLRNYQEPIEELNIGGSGLRLMNQEENQSASSSHQSSNIITVYPNPTSNLVNVGHNLNQENGKVVFKVYNMLGVEVLNENLTSTNNEVKINNLKSGVYFYSIIQNNQTIKTDKLMVR